MTDEKFMKLAYAPLADAWKIIQMTRDLKPDDDEGWNAFEKAQREFSRLYECDKGNSYEYFLSRAIMEAVDKIAKENEKS